MLEPSDAALDWIQEHYRVRWSLRDHAEVAREFNRVFGRDIDGAWIEHVIETCGRSPQQESGGPLLSWAQVRFLREAYAEHDYRECADLLNARYGTAFTAEQVHNQISDSQRRRHRPMHCGRTGRFEKGLVPINTLEPGTEVVRRFGHRGGKERDPQLCVVLDEPNPWTGTKHYVKRKAIVVWEKAHGPVPKDVSIVQVDGDWRNCDLDNLMALTRAELGVFNRHFDPGSLVGDGEARKAALLAARVKTAAHRRERQATTKNSAIT